jgi:hypothetical protein
MRTTAPADLQAMDESDWRLETAGDESFRGKLFVLKRFVPQPAIMWNLSTGEGTASEWDHEHCRFCWQTFAEPELGIEDALEEGYVTSFDEPGPLPETKGKPTDPPVAEQKGIRIQEPVEQGEVWVCARCFADFREHYGWTLGEDGGG